MNRGTEAVTRLVHTVLSALPGDTGLPTGGPSAPQSLIDKIQLVLSVAMFIGLAGCALAVSGLGLAMLQSHRGGGSAAEHQETIVKALIGAVLIVVVPFLINFVAL